MLGHDVNHVLSEGGKYPNRVHCLKDRAKEIVSVFSHNRRLKALLQSVIRFPANY